MRLNILFLYNASQTFTNTVYEHLEAFARFSHHAVFFCHHDGCGELAFDPARFDAICIHYCLRLAFDQLSPSAVRIINDFPGLKFIFIQDEYEFTGKTSRWIRELGIQLVFTVVPEESVAKVYPPADFATTKFVSNLTGYVPSGPSVYVDLLPPSQRNIIVGYRGRSLPIRFGQLGQEKILIGKMVKEYCDRRGIANDIAWSEKARIYGKAWYSFLGRCRATLGSESGSNVFDWNGTLNETVAQFRIENPGVSDEKVYDQCIRSHDVAGLMNQVSPRLFEAIAARSVLVLFEGSYSGVVDADVHYIALKKDGSNLDEVFARLHDGTFVDAMAERAFDDVIGSGLYSYPAFVRRVDGIVESAFQEISAEGRCVRLGEERAGGDAGCESDITTFPIRAVAGTEAQCAAQASVDAGNPSEDVSVAPPLAWDGTFKIVVPVAKLWSRLPSVVRAGLRPIARRVIAKRTGVTD